MATNLDVITEALRIANIIRETEVPAAAQSTQALTVLNDMLSDWRKDGIELGYYPQSALGGTIPLQDEDLLGVKYNLADMIVGRYGGALTPKNAEVARKSKARLEKRTTEVVESDFSHLPAGSARASYNINTD